MATLRTYRAKRRFDITAEPRGGAVKRGAAQRGAFVIQKHAARRLHYDLRLELDGVMKSWAVTRGPSLVPGEKRLAVHVEDHPIEYNAFEGTIPQGQYGGGTVMIWDRGEWEPQGDPRAGYAKGHLDFRLKGKKLRGAWHLVRMRKREGERQDPWLLIKSEDDAARSADEPDILEEETHSAATGRTMEQIAAGKGGAAVWNSARGSAEPAAKTRAKKVATPKAAGKKKPRATKEGAPRKRARTAAKEARAPALRSGRVGAVEASLAGPRAPLPDFVPPCLALLSEAAPDSADWVHEIKFDGYRVQAHLRGGKVQLNTRKGLDWTGRFAAVVDALRALPVADALIDGEIVVETAEGGSSFSALQEALKRGTGGFVFYVFDLLHLNGHDVRGAPLDARKEALRALVAGLPQDGPVRFSEHFDEQGSRMIEHACRLKLEGIVSKRRDAPYRSGRNGDWLKIKCSERQEFVVIGYADSNVDPRAIGALILGYFEDGALRYAGRVGTGFSHESARDLFKTLQPLRTGKTPLAAVPAEERGARKARWVAPVLVAEVDLRGWTHGDRVRHAAFKGLREDKDAGDVVREQDAMASRAAQTASPKARSSARTARAPTSRAPKGAAGAVRLTHPDRVYWADVGLTKQGLVDYYTQIWDWIAPHVSGRVLSLVRCPDGAEGTCFFQKHASAGLLEEHLRMVPEEGETVIAIDDLDGLIALVQAGVLEIHVRGSSIDRLEAANRIVFDLDPAPEVDWPQVKQAAREVRARLEALGLRSFLKTTGGKGLHVVAPIENAPWDEVKAFAKSVAFGLAAESPQRFLAVASKAARAGRIFIDYLRNSREATAICAYSTRARPGATVAVPIAWEELGALKTPNRYTVANLMGRLTKLKRDPWEEIGRVRQALPRPRRA
ncbi:MAG: DNA ligase D [Variibacter sp.]|nr:DNA ligase D [Variibacter sp.]